MFWVAYQPRQLEVDQAQAEPGGRPAKNGWTHHPVSQQQMAEAAGVSKRQEVTARRVASIGAGVQ